MCVYASVYACYDRRIELNAFASVYHEIFLFASRYLPSKIFYFIINYKTRTKARKSPFQFAAAATCFYDLVQQKQRKQQNRQNRQILNA